MASSDLDDLVELLSSGNSLKPYTPEDREAEAAKVARLRQLRLARNGTFPARTPVRG